MEFIGTDPESQLRAEYRRQFIDYLENPNASNHLGPDFKEDLKKIGGKNGIISSFSRLLIDINALQGYSTNLYQKLLKEPKLVVPAFEEGLKDYLDNDLEKIQANLKNGETKVGFVGEFGARQFSPRNLTSQYLSQLVNVVGIVTQCSLVCPKVVKSIHYCETTKLFTSREYRDGTSNVGLPTGSSYPTRDDNGNLLVTEYGLGRFRDQQVISIQELPEDSPPGQLPRPLEVILEDDLVDSCKPGDRVAICGIYRAISTKASGQISGLMRSVLIANTVKKFRKLGSDIISTNDLRNFKNLSQEEDCLDQLAYSLAPSIYGHEWVKKAIILLLVGGQEKNLKNGIHLRGDINCLMVGDPGVAKSQLLRAVMHVLPEAVSTTGRGSSGVGLTAALVTDSTTGERRLEAGATVLADRGVVCIDEFDKMNDVDRVAIHEVMEQQTVTIAKAGMHTSLNARCSVLAAANPIFGSFDDSKPLARNIYLPDPLLSRFDTLFVLRDETDEERDRLIGKHVISSHRYRSSGLEKHQFQNNNEGGDIPMYVKRGMLGNQNGKPPLTTEFLKNFIRYTKNFRKKQSLSDEAMAEISNYYVELRSTQTKDQSLPVTTRTLEALIRIATAHSKIRWSNRVDVKDVDVAIHIMDIVMNRGVTQAQEMANNTQSQPLQQVNENTQQQQQQKQSNGVTLRRRGRTIGSKRPLMEQSSQDENIGGSEREQRWKRRSIARDQRVVIEDIDSEAIKRLREGLGRFKMLNRFKNEFTVQETREYLLDQQIEISDENLRVFLTMASNTELQDIQLWFNDTDDTWTPM